MAHTLSSETIAGATLETKVQRTCVGIYIEVDPRRPMALRLDFADVKFQQLTVPGQAPTKTFLEVVSVGQLDGSEAEMLAMSCFPTTYAQLKAFADSKAAAQWPEIVAGQ